MGARRSATELRRDETADAGGTQRPANSGLILLIIDDHLIANHPQRRIQPALRLHVIDKAQFRIGGSPCRPMLLPLPPPSGMQRFTVQSWACSPTGSGPSNGSAS